MGFLEFLNSIESLVTLPAIVISLYLYFKDPIKRWWFLGYLPTAVLVIYDPGTAKVLIVRNNGTVGLPQGGIFSPDVTQVVEQTLRRELGIETLLIEIRYAKPLGTADISDRYRTRRITLGTLSLTSQIKGKGYIAFYISTNLANLKKRIIKGYGIDSCEIVGIDTAIKKITQQKIVGYDRKKRLLKIALIELKDYLKLRS